jgi:hypothetical protein
MINQYFSENVGPILFQHVFVFLIRMVGSPSLAPAKAAPDDGAGRTANPSGARRSVMPQPGSAWRSAVAH